MLTISESGASYFNWAHEEVPAIENWHLDFFSQQPHINGIFATDFILNEADGEAYAFENNPRLGSCSCNFLPVENMAKRILTPVDTGKPYKDQLVKAPIDKTGNYILMNEIFKLLEPTYYDRPFESLGDFFSRLQSFFALLRHSRDPLIDGSDIMPFLMFNYFQMPTLLIDVLASGKHWKKVDFQIGKVV